MDSKEIYEEETHEKTCEKNCENKKPPFWSKKWGSEKICGITHARLRPGKNRHGITYCVFLPCKHGFYRNALVDWINHSWYNNSFPTCPMCRREFSIEKLG